MKENKIYLKLLFKVFTEISIFDLYNFFKNYTNLINIISFKIKDIDITYTNFLEDSYEKYLNYKYWLLDNLLRFYKLQLHKEKSKIKILDLGTGFGYFPFICNYFGHHADAIDLDNNNLYNIIITKLNINRYPLKIEKYKILDVEEKYDLITAFMICFNNHKKDDLWGIHEWEFLINNLSNKNLNINGKLYFSFNSEFDGKPFNNELIKFYLSLNSIIKNNEVTINYYEQNNN